MSNNNNTTTTNPAAMTEEQLRAYVASLQAENSALKASKSTKGGIKVADKSKMVSLYGYGRFPVTVGAEAWLDIVSRGPEIVEFCLDNADLIGFGDPKKVSEERMAERKEAFITNAKAYLAAQNSPSLDAEDDIAS